MICNYRNNMKFKYCNPEFRCKECRFFGRRKHMNNRGYIRNCIIIIKVDFIFYFLLKDNRMYEPKRLKRRSGEDYDCIRKLYVLQVYVGGSLLIPVFYISLFKRFRFYFSNIWFISMYKLTLKIFSGCMSRVLPIFRLLLGQSYFL